MRQAQRAVSIDNISFITSAMEDRHHSASKDSNFSTLNNSNHSHNYHNSSNTSNNINGNNYHNNNNNHKTNNDDIRNNHNTINQTNHNTPINASTDNLHKASDDEPDNIIPWRAQLRKTNSRLSLIG